MGRKRKIEPFQLINPGYELTRNNVFQIGPRYSPPVDNTLIIKIFHRTTGSGSSILLDDLAVQDLRGWLALRPGQVQPGDTYTAKDDHRGEITFCRSELNGEPVVSVKVLTSNYTSRSFMMTDTGRFTTVTFLNTALHVGWEGWLPAAEVPMSQHGHVRQDGVLLPCKLCQRQGRRI